MGSLRSVIALSVLAAGCADGVATSNDAGRAPADAASAVGLPLDHCDGAHVPDQLFSGEVALTFDDGPSQDTTPMVIATLRAHDAPATFFIQGSRANTSAARAILDELVADPAFIIANHTITHPSEPYLDEMPEADAAAEIDESEAILRAHGETHRYFRFPYSRARCNTMRLIRQRGLTPVGVQIESADWCFGAGTPGVCDWELVPPEHREHGMIDFVLEQLEAAGGGVVLMHDVEAYTAAQLDALLSAIEAAGYRFVALDDASVFPRLNEERFVGDACRTDADCRFDGGRCHPAGFCTIDCDGVCPERRGWAPTFCGDDGDRGACMSVSGPLNRRCEDTPGTVARTVLRWVDGEPVPGDVEWVCAPAPGSGS